VAAGQGTRAAPPADGSGAHASLAASGWSGAWNTRLVADTPALIAAVKCNATYQTWTDAPGGNELRPMNCITWYEAMAFCAWDGGYLPTEAEWNLAAAGGAEQRAYPWSSPPGSLTLDGTRASYNNGTTCIGDGMAGCAITDLVFVGTKPAGNGRWGQSDLAGNVWEWTLDGYAAAYQNPCTDCANLAASPTRVVRGGGFGAFGAGISDLRTANRTFDQAPDNRLPGVGARCARRP
jgi:formylglycine-generating enzyme required for sulfatase activity